MAGGIRVAVQVGAAVVRVAVAGPRAAPQLVAQLPREQYAGLAEVVATWAGGRLDELVLVHSGDEPVAAEVAAAAPLAAVVRAVPAAEAAAVGTDAVAVLDAGHSGVEITVLGGGHTCVPCGGAVLDVELGTTAAARERLSLLPQAGRHTAAGIAPMLAEVLSGPVAELRAALDRAGVAGPVLLVGGLARTPTLASLVDAAGVRSACVPARPEAAAVLGALRTPSLSAGPASDPPRELLPPLPARPSPLRRRLGTALAAVAVAGALLAAGQLLPRPEVAAPAAGVVQYGYRASLPDGWAHTGGKPERRRTLLTPVAAPQGSDLVAIEASPLGYDPAAEPERAARELREVYDAGGPSLSDYDPAATYAGRAVTAYRQHRPDGLVVEWYVLFERDTQLSVGCQHTAAGAAAVAAACATVVETLHRT